MALNKLELRYDGVYINQKKEFNPLGTFKEQTIRKTLDFAYEMSFGDGMNIEIIEAVELMKKERRNICKHVPRKAIRICCIQPAVQGFCTRKTRFIYIWTG